MSVSISEKGYRKIEKTDMVSIPICDQINSRVGSDTLAAMETSSSQVANSKSKQNSNNITDYILEVWFPREQYEVLFQHTELLMLLVVVLLLKLNKRSFTWEYRW